MFDTNNGQGSGLHLKILEKLFRYNWKFIVETSTIKCVRKRRRLDKKFFVRFFFFKM